MKRETIKIDLNMPKEYQERMQKILEGMKERELIALERKIRWLSIAMILSILLFLLTLIMTIVFYYSLPA